MESSAAPANKELERTRSTQTAVGPRRSIQCYADQFVTLAEGRRRMRRTCSSSLPVGLLVVVSMSLASWASAETPGAYSLQGRYFYGQPDDPNPVTKIYVSGDWHRVEAYVDGKLRSIQISRPDRNLVYVVNEPRRTYEETSFAELKAAGWSPRGHPSIEEYREEAQKGKLVLTPLGSEPINGQDCAKFSITYGKGPPQFLFWVSAATGLPVLQTIQRSRNSRIEWSDLKVGPQPAVLFESPQGYKKLRSLK